MVDAVKAKMRGELEEFNKDRGSWIPDEEDAYFLNMLPRLNIDEDDLSRLEGAISPVEVELILEKDVDLDSSSGFDGFTYRLIDDITLSFIYSRALLFIFSGTFRFSFGSTFLFVYRGADIFVDCGTFLFIDGFTFPFIY